MDSRKIGILGGGQVHVPPVDSSQIANIFQQLGRMLVEAAHRLNITTVILDADKSPAKQINALHPHVTGSFARADDIRKLAKECDILTYEIEHIDTKVLEEIESEVEVRFPEILILFYIKDPEVDASYSSNRHGVPSA